MKKQYPCVPNYFVACDNEDYSRRGRGYHCKSFDLLFASRSKLPRVTYMAPLFPFVSVGSRTWERTIWNKKEECDSEKRRTENMQGIDKNIKKGTPPTRNRTRDPLIIGRSYRKLQSNVINQLHHGRMKDLIEIDVQGIEDY